MAGNNHTYDLVIHNATVVNEQSSAKGWVAVSDNFIVATGNGDADRTILAMATEVVDAHGDMLVPGAIDEHVHFREPGLTHKADMATESHAAAAGGVTSFIDMPNTNPQTVTVAEVDHKIAIASESATANFGFFIGATNSNFDELIDADYTRIAGVKLFLGSSTGNMLVDNPDALSHIFNSVKALIAVHAEHEATIAANRQHLINIYGDDLPVGMHPAIRDRLACLTSSQAAVALARRTGARLHLLHISTADELRLLKSGDIGEKLITAETCPQYLTFSDSDYVRLGARIKCNPAIKAIDDRDALRQAVADGLIDCIATDHAPHLIDEKCGNALTAVSGMPMIQFSLPVMMSLAAKGVMTPERVVETMAHNPARLFGIDRRGFIRPGYYADLVLLHRNSHTVTDSDVISRCGWTPLAGMELDYTVKSTWLNGQNVYDGTSVNATKRGMPLKFVK